MKGSILFLSLVVFQYCVAGDCGEGVRFKSLVDLMIAEQCRQICDEYDKTEEACDGRYCLPSFAEGIGSYGSDECTVFLVRYKTTVPIGEVVPDEVLYGAPCGPFSGEDIGSPVGLRYGDRTEGDMRIAEFVYGVITGIENEFGLDIDGKRKVLFRKIIIRSRFGDQESCFSFPVSGVDGLTKRFTCR